MRMIVGLGNFGEKYLYTRHNAGYMFLDRLISKKYKGIFHKSSKFKSHIFETDNLMFVKPESYMNLSGEVVLKLVKYYKLKMEDVMVIYDDLDLALGNFKVQRGRGPKDHNGVNSVVEKLKSENFWHVRIGVDNRDPKDRIPGEFYVLQMFSENEMEMAIDVFDDLRIEMESKFL